VFARYERDHLAGYSKRIRSKASKQAKKQDKKQAKTHLCPFPLTLTLTRRSIYENGIGTQPLPRETESVSVVTKVFVIIIIIALLRGPQVKVKA